MRSKVQCENSLAALHPELAAEWAQELNGQLQPTDVSEASQKKVWWRCKLGHVWEAAVYSRGKLGTGCPYCSNRIILPGFNDLQTRRPDMAAQYDEAKNGCPASSVMPGSQKKYWWHCRTCGHEWQTSPSNLAKSKSLCPQCTARGKRSVLLVLNGSVADNFPLLEKELVQDPNDPIDLNVCLCTDKKEVLWQCRACGNVWRASIISRAYKGAGCPACGQSHISSWASTVPQYLLQEWDTQQNGPSDTKADAGSSSPVWWKCKTCGYSWKASVYKRMHYDTGCPVCAAAKQVARGKPSLQDTNPEVLQFWNYKKNGVVDPARIPAAFRPTVLWRCRECGENWQATIAHQIQNNRCSFCTQQDQKEK